MNVFLQIDNIPVTLDPDPIWAAKILDPGPDLNSLFQYMWIHNNEENYDFFPCPGTHLEEAITKNIPEWIKKTNERNQPDQLGNMSL